jgi:hypothetical protein
LLLFFRICARQGCQPIINTPSYTSSLRNHHILVHTCTKLRAGAKIRQILTRCGLIAINAIKAQIS